MNSAKPPLSQRLSSMEDQALAIARLKIAHYRQKLVTENRRDKRQTILQLLAAEQNKLAVAQDSIAETTRSRR